MPPKIDPYATKLHKRINAILFVFTVIVIVLLLRASAHGQTYRVAEKISSEWAEDDWWAERAAFFFPRYQFTLQSTKSVLASSAVNTRDAVTATKFWETSPGTSNREDGPLMPDTVTSGNTTTWTGGGSNDDWGTSANWAGGITPSGGGDDIINFAGTTRLTPNNNYGAFTQFQSIFFNSGAGFFTLNGNAIKLYGKIENDSASTQTINFASVVYDGGPSAPNELNPVSGDIIVNSPIFLDTGSTLNIWGDNNHVLRFNGVIANGNATGSVSINQNSTVIYVAANTYTGDTQINAGDLRIALGGSASSSTIRLGGTGINSPAATLSLGTTAPADTGINISSTLVVRPSASGTQGTRTLRSLSPSGTNTYSGAIFLDADLTVQATTSNQLVFTGSNSIDVKNHVLTVNDAGNVNFQGLVTINEVLGSSLGAGGSLVKDGTNTLILQGTSNTYTGTNSATLNANGTQISGGTLGIYGDGSLGLAPAGAYNNIQFTGSATLQDTSNNISLNANRNISVASGATATFDSIGNTFTINGVINGSGNIAKAGTGSVVLAGANTFTGTTTINNGTLNAAATNALGSTSGITVNSGGTLLLSNSGTNDRINDSAPMTLNAQGSATVAFNTGGLSEHGGTNNTAGIGALTLQSSSIIDMGNIASIIAFANSLTASWSGTISIYDWSGIPVTGNGTDQLYFGNNATGLSVAQLADFQFYSGFGTGAFTPGAAILSTGEVVPLSPVPEPSTWLAGVLAFGAVTYTQRRRLAALFA